MRYRAERVGGVGKVKKLSVMQEAFERLSCKAIITQTNLRDVIVCAAYELVRL